MFSQTSEYALRVVVYLASIDGQPATIAQIAQATRAPVGYLAKVLRSLAVAGLIHSQRGLHGGSVLARPAEELTVYDVVQAVEPMKRITRCPLDIKAHGVNLCPLHRRLDQALATVQRTFQQSTIAEMVDVPAGRRPLCDLPANPAKKSESKTRTSTRARP